MIFGWSFPKLMIVIAVAFLLFGVPLMAVLVVLKERKKRQEHPDE